MELFTFYCVIYIGAFISYRNVERIISQYYVSIYIYQYTYIFIPEYEKHKNDITDKSLLFHDFVEIFDIFVYIGMNIWNWRIIA